MPRLGSIIVVLCAGIAACGSNREYDPQHAVPLPICDWPIPGALRLHVEEMTGHSYFRVHNVITQRVTFRPIPRTLAGDDTESAVWEELRLLDELGSAKIFGHRLTVNSDEGTQLIDADVNVYTVLLDNLMITTAGFSLAEVRVMVEYCNDTRRDPLGKF
jgi:hypothetical protein